MNSRYFLLLALIALLYIPVHAQDDFDAFKDVDFSRNALKQSQIQSLSLDDLKLLRGIVFGRHGRVFKDSQIKSYLDDQPWFKANPDFKNSMLNDTERRNLDLIRIAEAAKHETIQPGDMRYWRD
ncbi:MAG TPA: YARHG domain-containing protein, partial [Pyrinomonadaceae bacterium]|nr:YARHG domain-containing protein [Pyrinomonadaceae bacterium]